MKKEEIDHGREVGDAKSEMIIGLCDEEVGVFVYTHYIILCT